MPYGVIAVSASMAPPENGRTGRHGAQTHSEALRTSLDDTDTANLGHVVVSSVQLCPHRMRNLSRQWASDALIAIAGIELLWNLRLCPCHLPEV